MIYEFASLLKFLFPLENSRTAVTNYLTKENRHSILVAVKFDAIMKMAIGWYPALFLKADFAYLHFLFSKKV